MGIRGMLVVMEENMETTLQGMGSCTAPILRHPKEKKMGWQLRSR